MNDIEIDDLSNSTSPPLPEQNGSSNGNDASVNVELTSKENDDEDSNEKGQKSDSLLTEIDENQELNTSSDAANFENSNEDEKEQNNKSTPNGSNDSNDNDEQIGSGNLGHDSAGNILPAFESVDDELLSFNSESDFAIFQKQLNGDIPLQRVK